MLEFKNKFPREFSKLKKDKKSAKLKRREEQEKIGLE
jgi:hypothetical protein